MGTEVWGRRCADGGVGTEVCCLMRRRPPESHLKLRSHLQIPPTHVMLLLYQTGLLELIRVMGEFRKVVDTVNVDEPWLTPSE